MAKHSQKQPWLIEIAIESKLGADREKLSPALARLAAEDASFDFATDAESGQIIMKGVSEPQLAAKIDILKRIYMIEANIGAPQVAYRETITRQTTVDYTYKKQSGGHGWFARVKILAEPGARGSGFVFENKAAGGAVPQEFIAAVENGLEDQLKSGVLANFPVVDIKVSLVDGASHDVDSSAMTFEMAGRGAMGDALQKGGSVLLEPIMKVEVVTPEDCAGSVIADLNSRRAEIESQDIRGNNNVISAMVPLANMFSYIHDLNSMSQGRATFTMQFGHFAEAPLPEDDPPFWPAMGVRA